MMYFSSFFSLRSLKAEMHSGATETPEEACLKEWLVRIYAYEAQREDENNALRQTLVEEVLEGIYGS
jgi:hypothetical protein